MIYSATFYRAMRFFRVHKCSVILTVSLNILICFMRFANGKQNSKLLFYIDLYLQVGTFNAMVARSKRARPTTYLYVKSRGYLLRRPLFLCLS